MNIGLALVSFMANSRIVKYFDLLFRCMNMYFLVIPHLPTFFELGDSSAVSVGVPGVRLPMPLRRPVS